MLLDAGILRQPAVDLFAHTGDPVRRLQKSFPRDILSDPFQHQADAFFDLSMIHDTVCLLCEYFGMQGVP